MPIRRMRTQRRTRIGIKHGTKMGKGQPQTGYPCPGMLEEHQMYGHCSERRHLSLLEAKHR